VPTPIRPLDGLLAKIEGTYAVDSVPVVGTDAVRLSERLWNLIGTGYAWQNRRDGVQNGSLVPPPPAVPRGRIVTLDFGWELKGSRSGGAYAAGNKIEASPLIRSCCASETLVTTGGSESLTYQHADTGHDSCTIYGHAANELYKIVGCRGIFSWPINVGVLTTLRFRMQGLLLADPTTVAYPGGFTYATPAPLAGVNLALTIGAWTPDIVTASFDQAATLSRLDSGNATDGVQSFDVGETVQPMFRISAKMVPDATYNPDADRKAVTARALSLAYNSAVQYNRAKLTSNLYVDQIRHEDQNGFAGWGIDYLSDVSWALKFD
jgi:hypothetical protein